MYSYVARQPILDIDKKTIGYELLFRDGPKNTFPDVDPELATNRLLSDHFLTSQCSATGNKLGFVNFPYQSLLNQVPSLFPTENLIIEILEDCKPTDELLDAVGILSKKGYQIALDDFIPDPSWTRFLPYINIIKFDIRQVPIKKAAIFIERCARFNIQFLAEKVETYEEFKQAKDVGFELFQGYFFSKPEMLQQRSLEPSQLTVLQLYKEISQKDIDFEAVEKIVGADVSLSYKLLRYVNSSTIIRNPITSFKQALVYLGESRLRQFISLVAIAHANQAKPHSLFSLSIQRAKICEMLIESSKSRVEPGQAFLVGIFSLLESLLDQPLHSILERLPISKEIKSALTAYEGELGTLLLLVQAYEQADWKAVSIHAKQLNISEALIAEKYSESAQWVDDFTIDE
jgi:EAL and modified HD-GYP domain-containing signal transduction protein